MVVVGDLSGTMHALHLAEHSSGAAGKELDGASSHMQGAASGVFALSTGAVEDGFAAQMNANGCPSAREATEAMLNAVRHCFLLFSPVSMISHQATLLIVPASNCVCALQAKQPEQKAWREVVDTKMRFIANSLCRVKERNSAMADESEKLLPQELTVADQLAARLRAEGMVATGKLRKQLQRHVAVRDIRDRPAVLQLFCLTANHTYPVLCSL
jgi:hypothetical protein